MDKSRGVMEAIRTQLQAELRMAEEGADDLSLALEPMLLPSVADQAEWEVTEADELLERWNRCLPELGPANAALRRCGSDLVLQSCGAVRAYLERLLLDSGNLKNPVVRIELDPEGPILEMIVGRHSRLAQTAGVVGSDVGRLMIPAEAVAAHIAHRARVPIDVARELWKAIFQTFVECPYEQLFFGLDIHPEIGSNSVQVRLASTDQVLRRTAGER